MERRRMRWALFVGLASPLVGLGLFMGCKAGVNDAESVGGSGGSGSQNTSSKSGTGGSGQQGSTNASTGAFMATSSSGADMDVPMNPCGTACGPVELCDGVHKGVDDNCDGVVDEGCPCSAGQAESCFKGDPSYLDAPGCFPGTQQCTENGTWGPCEGGSHATDSCFANQQGCHPLSSVPFADVDLTQGIGNFGAGGGSYMLDCPGNVMPCPTPDANGHVQVISSGEYTVTYTDMNGMTCQFPLYVGAKGLRVELSWNYPVAPNNVDLDLHLHKPGDTSPWSETGDVGEDCGWSNCKIQDRDFPNPPSPFSPQPVWFSDPPVMPPSPVNWFLDPVMTNNTCYYAPMCGGGSCENPGSLWQATGKGCHNPRLDIDNIDCDPAASSSEDLFCNPENVNVDYPPANQWFRIGVHYWSSHGYGGQILPDVKVYCDGALAAELGSHGFYTPETPVTWDATNDDYLWLVGDVIFKKDQCSSTCIVQPIYANDQTKLPLFEPNQGTAFGPPYPPIP